MPAAHLHRYRATGEGTLRPDADEAARRSLKLFASSIIYEALFLGARPALALGRPDSKTSTHFLELFFAYEPKPDSSNIRLQFKLDSAKITSFAENLKIHPNPAMQEFVPDGVHRKALRPGLTSVASVMIRGVHLPSNSVTSSCTSLCLIYTSSSYRADPSYHPVIGEVTFPAYR